MQSAAAQFDAQFTAKSSFVKSESKKCTVYEHDVTHEATEIDNDDVFYDINSDLDTLQAYNKVTTNITLYYPRLTSNH